MVRWSGRAFEYAAARKEHRSPQPLFHSALQVHLSGISHIIEMTPAWGQAPDDRGVVCEGSVGARVLGRSRFFRYEVRRWAHGDIDDLAACVAGVQRLSSDETHAQRVLDLVLDFPTATWGRDELDTGEMWNSNSLTSWLLATSDHPTDTLGPPAHGRAPGWSAGLVMADRQIARRLSAAAPQ